MDRGKVFWEDDMKQMNEKWGRYLDMDGDGIPYRTLPGNKPQRRLLRPGTGHNEYASYSEEPADWEETCSGCGSR